MIRRLSRRNVIKQGAYALGALAAGRCWGQGSQTLGSMEGMRAMAAKAVITPQTLRDGATFLRGPFGNILVLAAKDNVLVVDSGLREARPQIESALTAISPHFPTTLINTHWHVDHTDGNGWMHDRGAVITAHRNTQKRLSTQQATVAMNQTSPAAPLGARPTDIFVTEMRKELGNVTLALKHYAPAHTDGDISVHLLELDVIHVGDIWYNGFYPLIDFSSGGRIDGMIKAAEVTLGMVTATTVIVPGHGPVGTREQLKGWHEMLTEVRETVATLKQQGKTVEEVILKKPTAKFDGRFIARAIPVEVFIAGVYKTV